MDDIIISLKDLREFEQHIKNNKVSQILGKLLEKAPNEVIHELKNKGITLKQNPVIPEDSLAQYLQLQVPGSSEHVRKYIEDYVPSIICIKDV